MMKRLPSGIRKLLIVLVSVAFSLLLLNYVLWLTSPLGYYNEKYNIWFLQEISHPHETGYQYEPGHYILAGFDVTVLPDGLRDVPDNNDSSGCTIAFVGDSLTWGSGVNDADTFVNILADEFDIHALNTGRNGYNATQVLQAINHYDADGYIYLHIHNDADIGLRYEDYSSGPKPNALLVYLDAARKQLSGEQIKYSGPLDMDSYHEAIQQIVQVPNMLMFSFAFNEIDTMAIEDYGATFIERYTDTVSYVDGHPNAKGHAFIAEQMRPHIESWLPSVCESA